MLFSRLRQGLAFFVMVAFVFFAMRVEAAERAKVRLLSKIDVKNFGSEQLRIGDLDGDGGPDLLIVQSRYATREITCLTAVTIQGQVLWQFGEPSLENGRIYSDLAVQIYDWDNDGENEVLFIRQAKYLEPWAGPDRSNARSVRERAVRYEGEGTMVVLEGKTGREKTTFPLPAGADDSFLFANLTGKDRREDLVVKDRYWNAWGVAHDGKTLWHWSGTTGHFPAIADLDDDGRDEVFFGFTLLDHDGKVLFSQEPNGKGWDSNRLDQPADQNAYQKFLRSPIHQDATYIVRLANDQWRLFFGNSGLHCLTTDGTELWRVPLGEAQHVVAGRFRRDSERQLAVVDRSPEISVPGAAKNRNRLEKTANYYLFDLEGKPLWKQTTAKGDWVIGCTSVNWFGPAEPENILLYGRTGGPPEQLLDGEGKVVAEFAMEYSPELTAEERRQLADDPFSSVVNFYPLTADVWGDCREEVILFGSRGLCIYTNPRPLALPTLYNETLYPGM